MKYSVTYACGHEGEVNLFGKTSERERKLAWLATCDCPACKAQAQAEKRAQKNAQSSAKAKELGFPPLTGTEKQIAWAETIRLEKYNDYKDAITAMKGYLADGLYAEGDHQKVVEEIKTAEMVVDYMMAHATKSSEWIENRNNQDCEMYRKYEELMKFEEE